MPLKRSSDRGVELPLSAQDGTSLPPAGGPERTALGLAQQRTRQMLGCYTEPSTVGAGLFPDHKDRVQGVISIKEAGRWIWRGKTIFTRPNVEPDNPEQPLH